MAEGQRYRNEDIIQKTFLWRETPFPAEAGSPQGVRKNCQKSQI
jgi:hypothetical protein